MLHWMLALAERDPECLLSMTEEGYRATKAEAGFDVDELEEMFAMALERLISDQRPGN